MYENMTFETILSNMLSRVTNDVDKREGSIIYDTLAPCAYHLAQTYFLLDAYVNLFFVDTAIGEYLDRNAGDYGLSRKVATPAERKIITTGSVNLGTRWGIEGVTYKIDSLLSQNNYRAICEQAGVIGNSYAGSLENIDNVSGVTATLSDIITYGSDEETDTELRSRIQQYLINPSQDGNTAQYMKWATEYVGIGAAKVFPLWNGGNTVKITITNGLYLPAEAALISEFQEYIDPEATGLGNGLAPIGCKVTVSGGVKKDINVTANVILTEGYTNYEGASDAISKYLASITYVKNSVSYMRIGSVLLDCASIAEISGLTMNGGAGDVILSGEEIPVLNSLSLTVVSS